MLIFNAALCGAATGLFVFMGNPALGECQDTRPILDGFVSRAIVPKRNYLGVTQLGHLKLRTVRGREAISGQAGAGNTQREPTALPGTTPTA
jgi:hypothetical protein